jgi:hypothetical protein
LVSVVEVLSNLLRKGSPLSKESDKSSNLGTLILKGLLIVYPSLRRDSKSFKTSSIESSTINYIENLGFSRLK